MSAGDSSDGVKVKFLHDVHAEENDYKAGDKARVQEQTAKFLTLRGLAELAAPAKRQKSKAKPATDAER